MKLTYTNPQTAIFLRRLAWELYVANKDITFTNALKDHLLPVRRDDLGLLDPPTNKSGNVSTQLQKLYGKEIEKKSNKIVFVKETANEWKKEWRLLYLPTHNSVRTLSKDPVFTQNKVGGSYYHLSVNLRSPAIPEIDVYIGSANDIKNICQDSRGIYIAYKQISEKIYIGLTDETNVRFSQNTNVNQANVVLFFTIKDSAHYLTLDSLHTTESLLISFWLEVATLNNQNRGKSKKPPFRFLQESILLTEGISAILLWLHKRQKQLKIPEFSIPFKTGVGVPKNWVERYLSEEF